MSAVLALDYGKKRTGLAITDPMRIIASPLETVETAKLFPFLEQLFFTEKVEIMVVGLPTHADGTPNDIESDIQTFIQKFQKKYPHILIEREDESFTSKEAFQTLLAGGMPKKKRQQKGSLDKVSAAIILQRYLERV